MYEVGLHLLSVPRPVKAWLALCWNVLVAIDCCGMPDIACMPMPLGMPGAAIMPWLATAGCMPRPRMNKNDGHSQCKQMQTEHYQPEQSPPITTQGNIFKQHKNSS